MFYSGMISRENFYIEDPFPCFSCSFSLHPHRPHVKTKATIIYDSENFFSFYSCIFNLSCTYFSFSAFYCLSLCCPRLSFMFCFSILFVYLYQVYFLKFFSQLTFNVGWRIEGKLINFLVIESHFFFSFFFSKLSLLYRRNLSGSSTPSGMQTPRKGSVEPQSRSSRGTTPLDKREPFKL